MELSYAFQEVNLKEESRRHMNEEADMKLKFDKLKKEMDRVTEQLERFNF